MVYVETADSDCREWEETKDENDADPIRELRLVWTIYFLLV